MKLVTNEMRLRQNRLGARHDLKESGSRASDRYAAIIRGVLASDAREQGAGTIETAVRRRLALANGVLLNS